MNAMELQTLGAKRAVRQPAAVPGREWIAVIQIFIHLDLGFLFSIPFVVENLDLGISCPSLLATKRAFVSNVAFSGLTCLLPV
jgi:hypothetical protein